MTIKDRARKINQLLATALEVQKEATKMNGHPCFNMKSITVLTKLNKQLEKAFSELANSNL